MNKAEINTEGWTKLSGRLGSNPGGVYRDPKGQKWYVKEQRSEAHAHNEKLAAMLYKAAGANVPDVALAIVNRKLGTASKWENKVAGFDVLNKAHIQEAQKIFAVHAWLGNWDAIGLIFDNQIWTKQDGLRLLTIDVGGALQYRAQGEPKMHAFGIIVHEWDSLRNKTIAPQAATVFCSMTKQQLTESLAAVSLVTNTIIYDLAHRYGFGLAAAKDSLAFTLQSRREDLLKRC